MFGCGVGESFTSRDTGISIEAHPFASVCDVATQRRGATIVRSISESARVTWVYHHHFGRHVRYVAYYS